MLYIKQVTEAKVKIIFKKQNDLKFICGFLFKS